MRCQICGRTLIDDLEVGQGFCVTPPCYLYASGRIAEGEAWSGLHPEFWAQDDVQDGMQYLCDWCGSELDEDGYCPFCEEDDDNDLLYD